MKIREVLFFSILIIDLISCSSKKVLLDDLTFNHLKYYYKDIPFTGVGISKFENGGISNEISFKNGIPDGKWKAYDYEGEIVQEGSYKPVLFKDSIGSWMRNIGRINICITAEGNYKFSEILVVLRTYNNVMLDTNSIKLSIINYLKSIPVYDIKAKSEGVKFVIGEFQ